MGKKNKLVYGVGINDADYAVQIKETTSYISGKQIQKLIWCCPFYQTWTNMLQRCYGDKWHERHPSYRGCSVCQEWLRFSNFKNWMEHQDWENKQLDKDLLFPGNKIYSPTTCAFVSKRINTFLIESNAARGELPIGVYYMKKSKHRKSELNKPYSACVKISGKKKHIGYFSTPEEAHQAWLTAKLELAKNLAAEIIAEGGDPRVAKALIGRYENYKENV